MKKLPEIDITLVARATFFTTLLRYGNVKTTATKLGVSASSVYQRLAHTELQLGYKIFDRNRLEGLVVTEEGQDLMDLMVLVEMAFLQFQHNLPAPVRLPSKGFGVIE